MAFKEISIFDIPKANVRGTKLCPLARDVVEFMSSNEQACELDIARHGSVKKAAATVRQLVWRRNFDCHVLVRDNRLFLVKKEEH